MRLISVEVRWKVFRTIKNYHLSFKDTNFRLNINQKSIDF